MSDYDNNDTGGCATVVVVWLVSLVAAFLGGIATAGGFG